MQNFIVLGYIPGTQIQINFRGWLIISLSLCLVCILLQIAHHYRIIARSFHSLSNLYHNRYVPDQQLPYMPAFK